MDAIIDFFLGLFSSPSAVFAVVLFIFIIIPSSIFTASNYHPHDIIGYLSKSVIWLVTAFLCVISPFSILLFFGYRFLFNKITFHFDKKRAKVSLIRSICKTLCLDNSQKELLEEFFTLFSKSLSCSKILRIKDIDDFIDWLYLSGFVVPTFAQFKQLGMNIITSRKIYVPENIRAKFPNWKSFRNNALDCGLLLSTSKSAPSIELWNTELATFLPGLFSVDPLFSSPDIVLELIVQVAEEGLDDHTSLPEYISRLSGLDHQPESEILSTLDSTIEQALRNYAHSLNFNIEQKPIESIDKLKREYNHKDRFKIVFELRTQQLLSWELDQIRKTHRN